VRAEYTISVVFWTRFMIVALMSEHAESSRFDIRDAATWRVPDGGFPLGPRSRLPTAASGADAPAHAPEQTAEPGSAWKRMGHEIVAGLQTLLSAAVYATLIVTFGVQVARVDGPQHGRPRSRITIGSS